MAEALGSTEQSIEVTPAALEPSQRALRSTGQIFLTTPLTSERSVRQITNLSKIHYNLINSTPKPPVAFTVDSSVHTITSVLTSPTVTLTNVLATQSASVHTFSGAIR